MKKEIYTRILYFLPALCWAAVLAWLSIRPSSEMPSLGLFQEDKIGHLAVYGLLTYLLIWGFRKESPNFSTKHILIAGIIASLFGVAMEFAQAYLSVGRKFDYYDMLANSIGAILVAKIIR